MKKLTALFMGCIMITGAFASCGKDSGDSSSKKENDPVAGKWLLKDEDDSYAMTMNFDSGKVKVEMDFSDEIHFKDKNIIIEGEDYGADGVKFEDNKLTASINGMDVLSMTRTEGEGDSFDGTYTDLSGLFFDSMSEEGVEASVKVEGESFLINYDNFCEYTIEGDETMILKNPPKSFLAEGEEDEAKMTFKVDGDNLSLTSSDGEVSEFTKVK